MILERKRSKKKLVGKELASATLAASALRTIKPVFSISAILKPNCKR
jgi:hypothetical protein